MTTQRQKTVKHGVSDNFIAGFASGVTGTVIGYPLDLVKTRLQVSIKEHKLQGVNTSFAMTSSILKNEGPRAFFKGLLTPLVSISMISSITFSSYSWLRSSPFIQASSGWDYRNGVAACICAPITTPITTLEGLVRTQMQVDNIHKKQYTGSWHCLSTIAREYGMSTLFTGAAVTVIRDAAYLCAYFYVYEGLKATLISSPSSSTTDAPQPFTIHVRPEIAVPIAGGTSGAVAWLVSIPIDTCRAGVQGQMLEADNKATRKTARTVFRDLLASKHGILALYRGVGPTIVRAFIVSASRFSAYELTLWLFRRQREENGV